nr:hypothetical protein [Pandoravirus aubagnensis]
MASSAREGNSGVAENPLPIAVVAPFAVITRAPASWSSAAGSRPCEIPRIAPVFFWVGPLVLDTAKGERKHAKEALPTTAKRKRQGAGDVPYRQWDLLSVRLSSSIFRSRLSLAHQGASPFFPSSKKTHNIRTDAHIRMVRIDARLHKATRSGALVHARSLGASRALAIGIGGACGVVGCRDT